MKAAIILGHRLNDDGSPAELLLKRIDLAEEIFKNEKPDYIILSGGVANKNTNVSEAEVMFEALIARGVPPERLIKEERSLTTRQNAKYALPMARALNADEIILCSTSEHMFRSWLNPIKIFRKRGLDNAVIYTEQGKTPALDLN